MDENKPKMSDSDWFLMIMTALFFDVIGITLNFLLPLIGGIISITIDLFATLTFFLWSKIKGIKGFDKKLLTGGLIEIIPVINALPAWTAVVVTAFTQDRAQKIASAINPALGAVAQKALGGKGPVSAER